MLSGGGTGGHIFPALSIAGELRRRMPDADILFVGAHGRMEMTQVPAAGYPIVGLPITGLKRSLSIDNLFLPFKLLHSIFKCFGLLNTFNPEAVIGTGGFASGPLVLAAGLRGIPVFIQEQNSYAGIANRLAARFAKKIFVAFEGMEKYFPKQKIIQTGNPIRPEITENTAKDPSVAGHYCIDPTKPTVLVVGGSLGALKINEAIDHLIADIAQKANIVWICGKSYYPRYQSKYPTNRTGFYLAAFSSDLYKIYPWADIVISRAGAGTLSELAVARKACILIPSPNVAENHQFKNALAFVEKHAAVMVTEDTIDRLGEVLFALLEDPNKRASLEHNIHQLSKPNATAHITSEILNTLEP